MRLRPPRRVKRLRDGTFRLDLPAGERDLLRRLAPQLRELVKGDDPDGRSRRLFPTAYASDAEADAEYQRLMRSELVESRLAAVQVLEDTADAKVLDEAQLQAWMGAVNAIRLVLGTILDVSEDPAVEAVAARGDDGETYALYGYLGFLLEELVQAAMG